MTTVEILVPGEPPLLLVIDRSLTVGRDSATDCPLDDPTVSRRHLTLAPGADGTAVVVTDLGSANGTLVDGAPAHGPTLVGAGGRIGLGDTVITVLATGPTPRPSPAPAGRAVTVDPGPHRRMGPSVQAAADRAWRRLAGLLPSGTDISPVIHLVHPFPDPADPTHAVTDGSYLAPDGDEAWTVVRAEAPPDEPARVLALLIARHLPAGDEVALLLEGYGLHVAGVDDTDDLVRRHRAFDLSRLEGEARAAAAVSFVRYLLGREKEEVLRELLRSTPKGRLDQAAQQAYGRPLSRLEDTWAGMVRAGTGEGRTGDLLRISLRYLRPYRWRQAEIFALMLLSLAFTVAFPFASRHLVDDAIPSGRFSEVTSLLGILAVAFTLSLVAGLRQAYQVAYVSGSVVRDLRQQLFDRVQHMPIGWCERHTQGDVLSRLFSDVRVVESGLTQAISQGVFHGLTLVVMTVVMVTISFVLGSVVLAGIPFIALVQRRMRSGARRRSLARQEESSAQMSVAAENLVAQPVVKLFGLERRESARFAAASGRVFRAERRLALFGGLFGVSVNMVVTVLRLGVLGLGAWLIMEGQLTLGGLVAFLAIMGEVLAPVAVLTSLGQELQRCTGALLRLEEVLGAPTEDEEDAGLPALGPVTGDIRFEGVSFDYAPGHPVLHDVDCVIPAGARVAFVGPSGSGKSTLLRLLLRNDDPGTGRVLVDGVDLAGVQRGSWRRQVGVVTQETFLFDASVSENIEAGWIGASDDEITAAARSAEAEGFVARLPRGYQTPVGERGSRLSGGQRQRIAIARALVRQPRVLVLDEATSALDAATERALESTLAQLSAGRTTVAVTHRLTSVTGFDRIFVLSEGRILESGTHAELVAAGGLYADLWSEQTGVRIPAGEAVDVAAVLGAAAPFDGLGTAELQALSAAAAVVRMRPGDEAHEGDGLLRVIVSGRAEVVGGLESPTEAMPGDVFGLAAALGDDRGRRLRAVEGVVALAVPWDEAARVLPAGRPGGPRRGTRIIGVGAVRRTHLMSQAWEVGDESRR